MKIINLSFALIAAVSLSSFAKEKVILKSNNLLKYKILPKEADSLEDFFKEGLFYARFRVNTFLWDWDKEYKNKTKDNWAVGVGGSLIYKSAKFKGISFTIGLYTSQNPWHMKREDFIYVKGADTFSKYKVSRGGEFDINTMAQSYIEYKKYKTNIRYGRQLFESLLAKSNDSKMIPNAFEGWSFNSSYFKDIVFKGAYFTKQKLRDKEDFHDVITYKDSYGNRWGNNDDSGAHEGLSYKRLKKADKDTSNVLEILELSYERIKNLKVILNYTKVPELLHYAGGDIYYSFDFDKFKISPGFRYIRQFDDGAGEVGGASVEKKTAGYKDKKSLDSYVFASRVDFKYKPFLIRLGYSKIEDKGDIVAPWRGLPTKGFTRAMSRKNWFSNTKSYMLKLAFDLDRAGILKDAKADIKYVYENYDDKKSATPPDSKVYYVGFFQKAPFIKGLYYKIRAERVDQKSGVKDIKEKIKKDKSFNEFRFEINYLF